MPVFLALALDSLVPSLAVYGFVALTTAFVSFPAPVTVAWPVVPLMFVLQFGLRLVFSRDASGRLIRVR